MSGVLFIGEAPGLGHGGPLEGQCGTRLATLAGMTMDQFLAATDRVNLMQDWPGDAWDGTRASFRAFLLYFELPSYDHVILCGRRVANAFGLKKAAWLSCHKDESGLGPLLYVFPHPSGRNLWWNDPRNTRRAKSLLRKVFT